MSTKKHDELTSANEQPTPETFTKWRMLNFQDGCIVSNHDDSYWKIGERRSMDMRDGYDIRCCGYGFHCSDDIQVARNQISGNIVARVEVSGHSDSQANKSAWEHMTIVQAWRVPSRDGINARLNAFATSDPWASFFTQAGYVEIELDDPASLENETEELYDDSYALQSALNLIYTTVPVEKRAEAYEQFVGSFIPLSHLENAPEKPFEAMNAVIDELVSLKKPVYTADEARKVYGLVSNLSSMVYNHAYKGNGTPVYHGESTFKYVPTTTEA